MTRPDLLHDLTVTNVERTSHHAFDEKEQQMPAVEDGDRQQVEDAEVDADHRHEQQQRFQADLRLLSRGLHDQDRTADIARRDLALQDLHDAHDERLHPPDRLLRSRADGLDRTDARVSSNPRSMPITYACPITSP